MHPSQEDKESIGPNEFFVLVWIHISVAIFNLCEFLKVVLRYYKNMTFLKADVFLRFLYLFNNPFTISKQFLKKRMEEDIYAYGETPLTSLEIIAKQCQIYPEDYLYELGSGRGRNCFWLRLFVGCTVVGVEYIPEFVEKANKLTKKMGISRLYFHLNDMFEEDFQKATVCYLYGTCLDDVAIEKMIEKFSQLPIGTKIITVSFPLSDYTSNPCFQLVKQFEVPYTWGKADVYLHVVVHS